LRWKLPSSRARKMRDWWAHHHHESQRAMSLHDSVECHEVRDVACPVVVWRCRKLHEHWQRERCDLFPKRPEGRVIDVAVVPMPREIVRIVQALEPRSEEHTSELQSLTNLVCRLLL